jgi:large subunit ribosomal protein L24
MKKIRKGDVVQVLSGRDKGKRGSVLRAIPGFGVIVEGVNKVLRATKANPMKGQVGGFVGKEMPMKTSKLALVDGALDGAGRVSIKFLDGGRKERFVKIRNVAGRVR